MVGIGGNFLLAIIKSIITGTNMKTLIEKFSLKSCKVISKFDEVLEVSILKPITVNRIRAITMLGKVVHIICPMCPNKSVPATAGARLVVSDRGDILSPKYEPEIIAPAVISRDIPNPAAAPINAIPTVPATVQELPIDKAINAQIMQLAE